MCNLYLTKDPKREYIDTILNIINVKVKEQSLAAGAD